MEIPLPESLAAKFQSKWKNNQGFYREREGPPASQQANQLQFQQDYRNQPSRRFLPIAQPQHPYKILPPTSSATPISVITSTSSATPKRHLENKEPTGPAPTPAARSLSKTYLDHGGTALEIKHNRNVTPVAAVNERIHCDCCDGIFLNKATFQDHIKAVYDARPHACDQCPQRFKVPAALRRHALIHSGERPYSCNVCGKSFNQSGSLKGHMRVHTGERPYECRYCDWTFSNSSNLLKHERKHQVDQQHQTLQGIVTHNPVPRRRVRQPWPAQRLQYQHQQQLQLERQQQQQDGHQNNLQQVQSSGYQKTQQQYSEQHHSYPQQVKIEHQRHHKYHGEDSSNSASTSSYQNDIGDVSYEIEVPQSPEDLSQTALPTPPKLKPKPDFLDVKPAAKRLKRSASDTLLDLRRLPDDVNISQLSRAGIREQSFKVEPFEQEPVVTTKASTAVRPLPTLKKAIVSPMETFEEKAQVFACDQCPRWFPTKARMKTHLASHTDERPYDCMYCGKKFKSTYALRRHIMIHEGIKPYQCSICFKRFNQTGSLTLHMRTHTGERPYTCHVPACSARFSNSSNLSKHVKLHGSIPNLKSKPSSTVTTPAGFNAVHAEMFGATWMDVVREENESHHVTPVYSCDRCDYSCKSAKTLADHKSLYHDD